ncbi:uncharacterized protein LOC117291580 isoform X1 [Asterias rubens]|uniref:uncharacterized protein LOC117291580 isoform X1 n=2 Tax=Asterias rubens TaxID=7604 RepID=UPI0014554B83|nr:uncharacterized protein LOC117291580 isoform X1 [Asterias rubens]
MDRRRRIKYKLARISEEDEDAEEEANEETSMMSDTFTDEQDSDSNMADPAPDSVSELTEDTAHDDGDSPPTVPASNGITHSESTTANETGLSVSIVGVDDDATPGIRDEGMTDIRLTPSTPPPGYKDPPSYNSCMKFSAVDSSEEKHKEDDAENLEWDQDESVEPHIVVNPLDTELEDQASRSVRRRTDRADEEIEMSEMAGKSPSSSEIMETSLIVPSQTDFRDQRYEMPDQPNWELPEMESQDQPQSSWVDIFHKRVTEISSRHLLIILFSVLIAIFAVLIIVLLPLSFSYLEYYELGLREQRSTGRIFFGESAFESGRHALGPDYTFKKYPSWATNILLENVAVTTTSGLAISFSCSFQYFIREDELGLLEQRFDLGYHDVIEFVAQAAIKNIAASTGLDMYLERRRDVEVSFHETLRTKLGGNCCSNREKCLLDNTCHLCSNSTVNCNQGYHVDIPFFQLLTINLPDVIVNNNLEVQLMSEQAEMETYIQAELLTRKNIEKATALISNKAAEVLTNGTAAADLILSMGEAEARAKMEAANSRGLALMYDRMGVVTDQHKASLHWLRMLGQHEMLVMGVSFEEYLQLMKNYTIT